MADKIVLMQAGRIEQIGSPEDVYDRPANKYVADFIGAPAMNFITGTVEGEGGAPVFAAEGMRIALPADTAARAGQRVICGIRPNDVRLAENGAINGRLVLRETTGAEVQLHAVVGGAEFTAIAQRGVVLREDDPVCFELEPDKAHLFDAETERRIEAGA